MLKALDVAKYLLSLVEAEKGQVISNLALQKLLYYCQGYYLAFSKGKEPLFEENIVAWKYGPVVKDVYYKYNEYGNNNIPKEVLSKSFVKKFTSEQVFVMKMVFDYFKDCSAIGLMNRTHNEEPWKSTKRNSIISFDKISSFFKDKFDVFCRDVDFEEFNEKTKKAIKDTEKNIGKSPTYNSASDMFASMEITTH